MFSPSLVVDVKVCVILFFTAKLSKVTGVLVWSFLNKKSIVKWPVISLISLLLVVVRYSEKFLSVTLALPPWSFAFGVTSDSAITTCVFVSLISAECFWTVTELGIFKLK